MKLVVALVALAICIGFRNVEGGPAPTPGLLAYPWTEWLKLRPPPPIGPANLALQLAQLQAAAAAAAAATPAPPPASSESGDVQDLIANAVKRGILPAVPKKKESKETADGETTTKKPKLIEVGDFWAPPTIGPNLTDVVSVMDPTFWAAKKTMFISKLFAALAMQVLNSTGTVTTTTESPDAALLREIDTVLLSDVARSLVDDGSPPPAAPPSAKELLAQAKAAKKETKKATKKTAKAKAKGPLPFVLAAKAKAAAAATTIAPVADTEAPTVAPHPTLDYSSLAKALLS